MRRTPAAGVSTRACTAHSRGSMRKYVVQERVLTLEQAVHKVTGHAAGRCGWQGVIAAGMDAGAALLAPKISGRARTRLTLPTGFDKEYSCSASA